MLARLVAGDLPSAADSRGRLFVDRDATHFRLVLNYLRDGECSLPATEAALSELLAEAEFYSLDGLRELVCPSVTAWRPGYALALRAALARSLAPGGGRAALGDALRTLLVCAFGPGGAAAAAGAGRGGGGGSPPFSPFSASTSSPFSNDGRSSYTALDASCYRIPGSRATVEAAARDVASHDGGVLLWTRRRLPPNAAAAAFASSSSNAAAAAAAAATAAAAAARLPPIGLPAIGGNRHARSGSVDGAGDLPFAGSGAVRAGGGGGVRGVRVRPASEAGGGGALLSSSSAPHHQSSAPPSVLLYTHLIQEAHIRGDAGSCEFEVTHELAHFVGPDPTVEGIPAPPPSSGSRPSAEPGLGLGSLSLDSEGGGAAAPGAGSGTGAGTGAAAAAAAAAASMLPTFAARLFRSGGAAVHPVDSESEAGAMTAPFASRLDSGGGLGLFQPRNAWPASAAAAAAAEPRSSSHAAASASAASASTSTSIAVPNNTRNNSSSNLLLSTSPTAAPSASAHCARGYALRDGSVAPSIVPVVRALTEALPRHQRCLRAAVLELARDPRGAEAALAAAGFSSATVRVESAAWPCDAFAAAAAAPNASGGGEGGWNNGGGGGGSFHGDGSSSSDLNDGGPAPAEDTFPSLPLTDVRVTVELVL